MRIISKYVLQTFTPILALTLSAFVGVYLIVDFFEKIDDLLEKQANALTVVLYFAYKTPAIAVQGIPMAALLATLITLGILNRNREIVALKAAGLNAFSYVGPILAAAALLSLVDFGAGETFARTMQQKSQDIWQQQVKNSKSSIRYSQQNVWYRGENAIYEITHYDRSTQTMDQVSLFFLDSRFRLVQRLDAKNLIRRDNRRVAEDGLVLTFAGERKDQERFAERVLDLKEKPEDFGGIATIPEELNWMDLYDYTTKIQKEGYNSLPYEVELHLRIAMPLTTLVLALLGAAISLRQGPHGGIAFSVGVALIVAFIYLTGLQLGCSMANAGILPPFIGVWIVTAIFAALGAYLWTTAPE
mgnify:CR=1 FL=1